MRLLLRPLVGTAVMLSWPQVGGSEEQGVRRQTLRGRPVPGHTTRGQVGNGGRLP